MGLKASKGELGGMILGVVSFQGLCTGEGGFLRKSSKQFESGALQRSSSL